MTMAGRLRRGPDGIGLYHRHWPHPDARGAIVLVHGLGEHLGRYEHVAPRFHAAGFDVRGTDIRGWGASEGRRSWIDSYETILDDLADDVVAAGDLGVPVVLLGHSLGALKALLYTTSGRPGPDLLVLSSPALRNTLPMFQRVVAGAIGRIASGLSLPNPVDVTQLSRDQAVGERYLADPFVVQRSTFGFARASFSAIDQAPEALKLLQIPTLVTHGAEDRIVHPSISEPLEELSNVERIVYEGFRHEPFNEEDGIVAVNTIVSWLDRQLA
jgi:alpha-beta hydrolase superfamily lysophospholipase